jgi:hypothetical protein
MKSKVNGNISLEKGVPIPSPIAARRTWPFNEMAKGDSFLVPRDVEAGTIRSAASQWAARHPGQKYAVWKTADGYRCWRTA